MAESNNVEFVLAAREEISRVAAQASQSLDALKQKAKELEEELRKGGGGEAGFKGRMQEYEQTLKQIDTAQQKAIKSTTTLSSAQKQAGEATQSFLKSLKDLQTPLSKTIPGVQELAFMHENLHRGVLKSLNALHGHSAAVRQAADATGKATATQASLATQLTAAGAAWDQTKRRWIDVAKQTSESSHTMSDSHKKMGESAQKAERGFLDLLRGTERLNIPLGAGVGFALRMNQGLTQLLGTTGLITVAVGGLTSVLGILGRNFAQSRFELQGLQQQTGLSAQHLLALRAAAEITDLPLENMARAVERLKVNLSRARQGPAGGEPFYALTTGLGFSDAQVRGGQQDPFAFLVEVAKRYATIPDVATRARIQTDLFGESSVKLDRFLRDLAQQGVEGLNARLKALGVTMTQEGIDKPAQVEKQWKALRVAWGQLKEDFEEKFGLPVFKMWLAGAQEILDLINKSPAQKLAQRRGAIEESIAILEHPAPGILSGLQRGFMPFFGLGAGGSQAATLANLRRELADIIAQQDKLNVVTEAAVKTSQEEAESKKQQVGEDAKGNLTGEERMRIAQATDAALKSYDRTLREHLITLRGQALEQHQGIAAAERYVMEQRQLLVLEDATNSARRVSSATIQEHLKLFDEETEALAHLKTMTQDYKKTEEDSVKAALKNAEVIAKSQERRAAARMGPLAGPIVSLVGRSADEIRQLEEQQRQLHGFFPAEAKAIEEEIAAIQADVLRQATQLTDTFQAETQASLLAIQRLGLQLQLPFVTDDDKRKLQIIEKYEGYLRQIEADMIRLQAEGRTGNVEELRQRALEIPRALTQELSNTSRIVRTLGHIATAPFDAITEAMTGAIQQGKSLNDVLRNLGSSLLLGLSRSIVQAAFEPLKDQIHKLVQESAAPQGGGILRSIINFFSGAGAAASGPPAFTGIEVGAFARGGKIPSLATVNQVNFRLRQFAKGGVTSMDMFPLPPPADTFLPDWLLSRFAAGGITPSISLHPLFSVPSPRWNVPRFQAGGIVDRPSFALIGEQPGRFEAVVPLPDNRHIPVTITNGAPGGTHKTQISTEVHVHGDIIPRLPAMTPDDVVTVIAREITGDRPLRSLIRQQAGR